MPRPDISIIIPTLNEQNYLAGTIQQALDHLSSSSELEILVVDAGSTDGTVRSVEHLPVTVFEKPDFRLKKYMSLNFGISKAQGDILLFLDADTRLPYHFDLLITETLSDKKVVGGAFEFSFTHLDWRLWLLQLTNRIRYRVGQMYYGDQAIFCLSSVAKKLDGFPEKKLMESAFFCKMLKQEGRLKLIKKPIATSPRRFLENGLFKVSWFDFSMWVRFLLHLPVEEYGQKYWKVNMRSDG